MKKFIETVIFYLCILVLTILLSRYMYAHPDIFPKLPESMWHLFDRLAGDNSYEGQKKSELVAVVVAALIEAVIITYVIFLGLIFFRKGRRRADTEM